MQASHFRCAISPRSSVHEGTDGFIPTCQTGWCKWRCGSGGGVACVCGGGVCGVGAGGVGEELRGQLLAVSGSRAALDKTQLRLN